MNSMFKEITWQSIAAQIRMERATYDGVFLLLEGDKDARYFKNHIDERECVIAICLGRDNLIEIIRCLDREDFSGVVGLADKDYADYIGFPLSSKNLIFTDENDFEMMIFLSPSFDNLLNEIGRDDLILSYCGGDVGRIRSDIFAEAAWLGVLRLLSHEQGWGLDFEGMDLRYGSNRTFNLNRERLVVSLLGRSKKFDRSKNVEDIVRIAEQRILKIGALQDICRGHDVVRIVGRALRFVLGRDGRFDGADGAELLESILRLSYSFEYFCQTKLYKNLSVWQQRNGYKIFIKD